ncbi:MAG: hypothetical protein ACOCUR_01015 [Nanoarchaeota archaeon]
MIQARFELDEYTKRVLDVIKGKYGLKNRSEALHRLISEYGQEYVDPQPNQMVLRELDVVYKTHQEKHGERKMTDAELKELLDL